MIKMVKSEADIEIKNVVVVELISFLVNTLKFNILPIIPMTVTNGNKYLTCSENKMRIESQSSTLK